MSKLEIANLPFYYVPFDPNKNIIVNKGLASNLIKQP